MKKLALGILTFGICQCFCLGDCKSSCVSNCAGVLEQCLQEDTIESIGNAIQHIEFACSTASYWRNGIMCDNKKIEELKARKAQKERTRYANCNQGNASACFDIGYEKLQECEDVECNQTDALTYFSKACDLKDKVGCFNTGSILETNLFYQNPSQAQIYYRKACNMGYKPACFKLK